MRIVKRYSNRRLYDAQASRTITQFDLARMIREGHEVKVVDSASGRDITAEVLGRVLVAETARHSSISEAGEFLKALIKTGGDKSMSILRNTVLASIGALHVTKAKAEKIIDDLIKKGDLDKSDRKKAVMELLEKAEKSTAEFRQKVSDEAGKAQKNVSKFASGIAWVTQDEFKKLDARLKKLTARVKELEDKKAG
jgi:polyhydroxyalkanoate synthesis repressor PhaR